MLGEDLKTLNGTEKTRVLRVENDTCYLMYYRKKLSFVHGNTNYLHILTILSRVQTKAPVRVSSGEINRKDVLTGGIACFITYK